MALQNLLKTLTNESFIQIGNNQIILKNMEEKNEEKTSRNYFVCEYWNFYFIKNKGIKLLVQHRNGVQLHGDSPTILGMKTDADRCG